MTSLGNLDVLVLDLKLPVLAGLQVYQGIARSGAPPRTLIVTSEAHDRWPAIDVLSRIPIDGIVAKPVDPDSVLASIASLFGEAEISPTAANG